MKPRVTFGYLTYVNEKNSAYRLDDFRQSIDSMRSIAFDGCEVVHVDNASLKLVNDLCDSSGVFAKKYRYDTNFVDIALFYTALWRAKDVGSDYVGFLYDDSIAEDGKAVKPCVEFLDANPDVACLRVAKYQRANSRAFDTNHTSKAVNPDSVRHFNSQTHAPLVWSDPIRVGGRTFYKNNWHSSSRPCVWRVEAFEKMVEGLEQVPILQGFEKHCMERYEQHKMVTGVLDGGLVYTTTVKNSARTNELDTNTENRIRVDLAQLRAEFDKMQNIMKKYQACDLTILKSGDLRRPSGYGINIYGSYGDFHTSTDFYDVKDSVDAHKKCYPNHELVVIEIDNNGNRKIVYTAPKIE